MRHRLSLLSQQLLLYHQHHRKLLEQLPPLPSSPSLFSCPELLPSLCSPDQLLASPSLPPALLMGSLQPLIFHVASSSLEFPFCPCRECPPTPAVFYSVLSTHCRHPRFLSPSSQTL